MLRIMFFIWLIIIYISSANAEVIRSSTPRSSGVYLTSSAGSTVTSIIVPAGNWNCSGAVGFGSPTAGSSSSIMLMRIAARISLMPGNFQPSLIDAHVDGTAMIETTQTEGPVILPIATTQLNLTSPAYVYLLGKAYFSNGPEVAYGDLECQR